jgi:putative membrane protein
MSKKPIGPLVIPAQTQAKPAKRKAAVVERAAPIDPASAPPVPDITSPDAPGAEGQAMIAATRIAARPVSWISRMFWLAISGLLLLWLSTATWDFTTDLLSRNVWLGRAALALGGMLVLALIVLALREIAGFARLSKIDDLRRTASALRDTPDEEATKALAQKFSRLYAGREEMSWALSDMKKHQNDVIDPADRLDMMERTLMSPLDTAARKEIEKSARQVAAVTAIVPLALADVVAAFAANTRMIRRIAEIYGGRAGTLGSWRLFRAVATHLIATGAVGVADDLIGSVAGGGAVAKLSRRFGEGIINGALTARVGLAAMDICRPMPFFAERRPRVTSIVKSALTGVFGRG